MPIQLPHPITALSEQDFHQLDYYVMAKAFEVHNQLGRFYDEQIYKNTLMQKCLDDNFEVESEVEIKLIHKDYSKSLFIDLLINHSVYELKAIKSIQDPQRIQTLDYIFATNTQHGKIINFRPMSVEHEFVSTTLDHETRAGFHIKHSQWNDHSEKAKKLKNSMVDLLTDWGAFFDTHLYSEALIHFLGGKQKVVRSVEISNGNQILGHQKFACLSCSEFFLVTAAKGDNKRYKAHLNQLLTHSPFEVLYWINLNRLEIQFTTIEKKSFCL